MKKHRLIPELVLLCALPCVPVVAAQSAAHTAPAHSTAPAPALPVPAPTEKDVASTQSQLIKLLRLSPTLTTVVSHDPSLLANQEYVARTNPQLADFLTAHPEVARNPEFYLFSHLQHSDGERDEALEKAVWPELVRNNDHPAPIYGLMENAIPVIAFAIFLGAAIIVVRLVIENRRWNRIFKLQSEVHGRLIDKFSSTQELGAYMETEAGKKFLEAAPIPVNIDSGSRVPNSVARVLTPLQIGVVMVLLGMGMLSLRHASIDADVPMLILGTVVLMPGLGFIISAGITWLLAARLGLMPPPSTPHNRYDATSASPLDRQ
jgi:hypothetical protein